MNITVSEIEKEEWEDKGDHIMPLQERSNPLIRMVKVRQLYIQFAVDIVYKILKMRVLILCQLHSISS